MKPSAVVAVFVILVAPGARGQAPANDVAEPFEVAAEPKPRNQVDELVFRAWKRKGVRPARPCSDAVFVRRVFLDLIGTLPTEQEARVFLADESPNKRQALIGTLLGRDEFADYWAMRWCDLLRVKSEFPINLWPNAAQAYHRWIRDSLARNVGYDAFVRALLTSSGSNFRVPPVNFYRAVQSKDPETLARTVALTFMGSRAEQWPKERLAGMAGFFAQVGYKATAEWKEEIVYFDPELPAAPCAFPDGTEARVPAGQDPRVLFADWLIDAKNPWFARNAVNRAWSWLFGRGIVHEPDDLRPDNPPADPELLAWLEHDFTAAGYDLRHLLRVITSSQTYQLSSVPRSQYAQSEALFASYPLRRLDAEVLIDALNQITGSNERYASAIPEPFTFVPANNRTITLPDGSITSSFLELFGRPPRDTGLESERNLRPSAAQRLHLLNSSHVKQKIEQGPKLRYLRQVRGQPRQMLDRLYLSILSRYPTEAERQAIAAHVRSGKSPRQESGFDVAWALINSAEFLYRH